MIDLKAWAAALILARGGAGVRFVELGPYSRIALAGRPGGGADGQNTQSDNEPQSAPSHNKGGSDQYTTLLELKGPFY